jgi:hypothetical protein
LKRAESHKAELKMPNKKSRATCRRILLVVQAPLEEFRYQVLPGSERKSKDIAAKNWISQRQIKGWAILARNPVSAQCQIAVNLQGGRRVGFFLADGGNAHGN